MQRICIVWFGFPNLAYSNHHPLYVCLYYFVEQGVFNVHALYLTHTSLRYLHQVLSIYAQFDGHICFCTYFVITIELEATVGCVLAYIYAQMLGLSAHLHAYIHIYYIYIYIYIYIIYIYIYIYIYIHDVKLLGYMLSLVGISVSGMY